MNPSTIVRLFTVLSLALVSTACSRDVPSTWPDGSPASSAAQELPNAKVTLALDGDPPLPGEPAEGWFGLEQVPVEDPHAHHRHHAGHGATAPEQGHEGHDGHEGHEGHENHGGSKPDDHEGHHGH